MCKIGSIQISLSTQKDIIPPLEFFFFFFWVDEIVCLNWTALIVNSIFFIFIAQIPSFNLP